jgi:Fe-S-cluster containining protein
VELVCHDDYFRVPDIRHWLALHGITTREDRGVVLAHIPVPCGALGADNRCTVYETRPEVCRSWPTSQADLEDPRIAPYCTLHFEKDESDLLPMIERRTG